MPIFAIMAWVGDSVAQIVGIGGGEIIQTQFVRRAVTHFVHQSPRLGEALFDG